MCSRVGRSRKSKAERQVEIFNAILEICSEKRGWATVTKIARKLEMQPSTHLKKLIVDMATKNEIDMRIDTVNNGGTVYKFYISDRRLRALRKTCGLPWGCDANSSQIISSICKDKDGKICPALHYSAKE